MSDPSDEEAFDWGPGLDDTDDRTARVEPEAGPRETWRLADRGTGRASM